MIFSLSFYAFRSYTTSTILQKKARGLLCYAEGEEKTQMIVLHKLFPSDHLLKRIDRYLDFNVEDLDFRTTKGLVSIFHHHCTRPYPTSLGKTSNKHSSTCFSNSPTLPLSNPMLVSIK